MINYENIYYESSTIIVRPLQSSDYKSFLHGYKQLLPSKNRFDEGCFDTEFMTYDWYIELLERRKKEAEEDYCYMLNIFRKKDNLSIGYCDITPHRREEFQYARIGYTIHNNFWGCGYGTETVKAIVNIGFKQLNLHRLEAHINLDNHISQHVAKKGGLLFESVRKKFILEDGIWTDNQVFYVNNENWKSDDED
ncbi:acetyltransferase, GNAT family [Lachnospiraceae bacterium KM106-2]|nr:acetyltransferase, GNAT family [Lachnospiraceae bacterium KM106-2]